MIYLIVFSIILVIVILILFAIFYKPQTPESFSNLDKLMEKKDEIKESPMDELLKITKPTFVMFFANWCDHCQRTKPEFNKLRLELEAEAEDDIKVVMIDCDDPVGRKIARDNGVDSFPTFKLFPDGISGRRVIDCKTERNVESWNKFLKKHL